MNRKVNDIKANDSDVSQTRVVCKRHMNYMAESTVMVKGMGFNENK